MSFKRTEDRPADHRRRVTVLQHISPRNRLCGIPEAPEDLPPRSELDGGDQKASHGFASIQTLEHHRFSKAWVCSIVACMCPTICYSGAGCPAPGPPLLHCFISGYRLRYNLAVGIKPGNLCQRRLRTFVAIGLPVPEPADHLHCGSALQRQYLQSGFYVADHIPAFSSGLIRRSPALSLRSG